jgi:hypothetical protein
MQAKSFEKKKNNFMPNKNIFLAIFGTPFA